MPSANPKLEKQQSAEPVDCVRQTITVIEHKIRNLEKRKGKLESYRDLQKNGRELNADQTKAVARYDGVLQSLETAREIHKQVVGVANESVKQQKKLARKEAAERTQQDIAKVREILLIQDIMTSMSISTVREDFLSGTNGAIQISNEELKYIDDLYKEIMMKHKREEGEPTIVQQIQKAAEHYVAIVDGKQREVAGTTYNKLKEIINSIHQSGYFDQTHASEPTVEENNDTSTETQVTTTDTSVPEQEEFNNSERHIPPESIMPIPSFPVQVAPLPVVSGTAPVTGPISVVPQPIPPHPTAPVEPSYYTNATGFVPQPQPQQQQQQQQPPPPPPQQQQQQQQQQQPPTQPQQPRINDVIGTPNFFFLQESELDSPDVTSQNPIVSHIPAVNAPIPSQTFTNQNFTNATVVPQQVIYQHQPSQDMSHIPGFSNPNPPPPIPMPPSHQPNIQFSPQHPAGFQQQAASQPIPAPGPNFEPSPQQQQDGQEKHTEETKVVVEQQEEPVAVEVEVADQQQPTSSGGESFDWVQLTEPVDWNQAETAQPPIPDTQQQQPQQPPQAAQQAWSGYRGRGGRRGNSNGYNGRGRGGYQQNGRAGQAYYRNDSNYQNGYQQRSWANEGNGYNGGFKRGGGGNTRGGPRGERGIDRGGRAGGQFRGQRGGNRGGGGYAPRGKPQQAQQ